MSFRNLLDKTAYIKRATETADGQGGYTTTWSVRYPRVACRFQPITSRETTLVYDKKTVFANYYIYVEYLKDVAEGDRIYLGTRVFQVKLIVDWDEQNNQMKLAAVEVDRA